jgi:hypothetical protein
LSHPASSTPLSPLVASLNHLLGRSGGDFIQHRTNITFNKNGQDKVDTGFCYFLLRHSSLLDPMILSNFIFDKFSSTHLGREAPAVFCINSAHQMAAKFDKYKDDYGSEHLSITCFFRIVGCQSLLFATDTSFAIMTMFKSEDSDQDHSKSINTALEA